MKSRLGFLSQGGGGGVNKTMWNIGILVGGGGGKIRNVGGGQNKECWGGGQNKECWGGGGHMDSVNSLPERF